MIALVAAHRDRLRRDVQGEGRPSPGLRTDLELAARSWRAISRLIDRPRPVPPYLRLVVPSACWNALENQLLLVLGNADAGIGDRDLDRLVELAKIGWLGLQPLSRSGPPGNAAVRGELERVGQKVEHHLLSLFLVGAVIVGRLSSNSILKSSPLSAASWRKVRSICCLRCSSACRRSRSRWCPIDLRQVDDREGSDEDPDFWFRGGATIIVDLRDGLVQRIIRKRIDDDRRLAEQRSFLLEDELALAMTTNECGATLEPFAFMHGDEPSGSASGDEGMSVNSVIVRMYRKLLGDCFLIIVENDGKYSKTLVDCGILQGTPRRRRMDAQSGRQRLRKFRQ